MPACGVTRHKAVVVQQAYVKESKGSTQATPTWIYWRLSAERESALRQQQLENVIHLYLLLWKVGFPSPGLRMELEMVDETDREWRYGGRLGLRCDRKADQWQRDDKLLLVVFFGED